MNKRDKSIIDKYNDSELWGLDWCYERRSRAKEISEERIINKMQELNGYDYKVIGYNIYSYSCGFLYERDDKTYLRYYTSSSIRDIEWCLE